MRGKEGMRIVFWGRNVGKRIACFAAAVCVLLICFGCAVETGGIDTTAPMVSVNGMRVDTMTFLQTDLAASEAASQMFDIYLQEYTPLETSVWNSLQISLPANREEIIYIEDFLLDEDGNIRSEEMAMTSSVYLPAEETVFAYPLDEHTAARFSSLVEPTVLRGFRVSLLHTHPENSYVFILRLDRNF